MPQLRLSQHPPADPVRTGHLQLRPRRAPHRRRHARRHRPGHRGTATTSAAGARRRAHLVGARRRTAGGTPPTALEHLRRRRRPARVRHLPRPRRRGPPAAAAPARPCRASWSCTPCCASPPPGRSRCWSRSWPTAGAVVTMTGTARDRLLVGYAVDAGKVDRHPARRRRPRRPCPARAGPARTCSPGGCSAPARASSGRCGRWPGCGTSTRRPPTPSRAGPTRRCSSSRASAYRAGLHRLGAAAGRRARRATTRPVYHDAAALGRADPLRRRGRPAVRLPRAGHLRRAHRGGGRRGAGRRHRASRTPSSCSPTGPVWSCPTATRRRWPTPSGGS